MKTESNIKPNAYLIEEGEKTFLIFNDDIVEEQREEEIIYKYNSYQLYVEGDKEYVLNNLSSLHQLAIDTEYNQLANEVRERRKRLLEETDNYAMSDRTMSDDMKNYRQALRDITEQEDFPYNVIWPEKPNN